MLPLVKARAWSGPTEYRHLECVGRLYGRVWHGPYWMMIVAVLRAWFVFQTIFPHPRPSHLLRSR